MIPWLMVTGMSFPSVEQRNSLSSPIERLLSKRSTCSYNCNTSCNPCTGSYCSSSCSNCISNCCDTSCCRSQCNICQQPFCQSNVKCRLCCTNICKITTTTSKTETATSTTTPTTPTSSTSSRTTTASKSSSSNVALSNTVTLQNIVKNMNSVSVPVNIKNMNKISIAISTRRLVTSEPISSTSNPTSSSSTSPITSTKSTIELPNCEPSCDFKTVVLSQPLYPVFYPIYSLPCFDFGCQRKRYFWTGSVCNEWSQLSGEYTFAGGYIANCRAVQQDCTLCGSNFFNQYHYNSFEFDNCYGCFI